MNIFEALRNDHKKQRTIIAIMTKTHGDSDGRHELLNRLKTELHAHAKAEERFLYIPLLENNLTQEKARHSIAEHKEIDDFIEELESTDFSSAGWLVTAKKLAERLTHHLDEEEHEVFQLAGKVLSENEKTKLAQQYSETMSQAKQAL